MQIELIENLKEKASRSRVDDVLIEKFKNEILEAYRIRIVEQQFLKLFSEAKLSGTVHTCIGQELSGIAISKFLFEDDWMTSNHRCHGHYISRTKDWKSLVDELLGDVEGTSKGIGSSQHLYKDRFISNGTQGSLLPVACGAGLYEKICKKNNISVSFIGEGTLGEGVVYETFNLGCILGSPHLIVCENNYYSQTTPQSSGVAGSISARASAFGLKVFECDTWNLETLFEVSSEAVNYVRTNKQPAFLKIDTYRLMAHSKGDDDREESEIEFFRSKDLLNQPLVDQKLTEEFGKISLEVDRYVQQKLNNVREYNYDEYLKNQLPLKVSAKAKLLNNRNILLGKALNEAYFSRLDKNKAIFIGEDIVDPYGGAFKITKGFSVKYPERVLSTSISEAGLVGVAIGVSLAGGAAYAEIMFGDFIVNAMDQIINNASKFYHMYGHQISCDVTVRTPMGGGRGYGPTHSQSLEKMLLGLDNVLVASLTSMIDPAECIDELARMKCPKIIIENKVDYGSYLYQPLPGFKFDKVGGDLGTIRLKQVSQGFKADYTIISHGRTARLVADNMVEIFEKTDRLYELLVPQLLSPIPYNHFEKSIRNTGKVVIVEEGTSDFGWSDGIASIIARTNPGCRIIIVSSDPVPIPSKRSLEDKCLVSIQKVIEAINKDILINA